MTVAHRETRLRIALHPLPGSSGGLDRLCSAHQIERHKGMMPKELRKRQRRVHRSLRDLDLIGVVLGMMRAMEITREPSRLTRQLTRPVLAMLETPSVAQFDLNRIGEFAPLAACGIG